MSIFVPVKGWGLIGEGVCKCVSHVFIQPNWKLESFFKNKNTISPDVILKMQDELLTRDSGKSIQLESKHIR